MFFNYKNPCSKSEYIREANIKKILLNAAGTCRYQGHHYFGRDISAIMAVDFPFMFRFVFAYNIQQQGFMHEAAHLIYWLTLAEDLHGD